MRERSSSSTRVFTVSGSHSGSFPMILGAEPACGYDWGRWMLDDVSAPQARYVKTVQSYKFEASQIHGIYPYVLKKNYGATVLGADFLYIEHLPITPSTQGSLDPGVDWTELIASLSKQVDGILQTDAMTAVTMRDIAQTVKMVTNPFSLLKGGWRDVAGLKPAAALAKKSTNLWLEYRYGWNAGYLDLRNHVQALDKLDSISTYNSDRGSLGERLRATATVSGTAPYTSYRTELDRYLYRQFAGTYYDVGFVNIKTIQSSTTCNVFCTRAEKLMKQFSYLDRIKQAFGCTMNDLLPVLWEVIPYSFVVDWFVNTQQIWNFPYARRLSQANLDRLGFSSKRTWLFQGEFVPGCWDPSPGYWWTHEGLAPVLLGSVGKRIDYARTAGIPAFGSFLKMKGLSTTHSVDGISLLVQRLLGKPHR